MHLPMRTGFEVELLAPAGSDRQVLADELGARAGGLVRRSFHSDSEASEVPGVGLFRHLSPAFDVFDADAAPLARLVDDITITADLAPAAGRPAGSRGPGHRGWYRVLCDEPRLLRLIEEHIDPEAPLSQVLRPVAELFGVSVQTFPTAAKVDDRTGASIAVALPLPPGRERPCEVITPPLTADHAQALERLLAPARELGFSVPQEAAVHLHVDGAPFRHPHALANLVRLFGHWRPQLWAVLGTNPACRRLGPLPQELLELVEQPWQDEGGRTGWQRLQEAARAVGVSKYADVNLSQLVSQRPLRDTVEVRVLPGDIDGHAIVERAALVQQLLARCLDPHPLLRPDQVPGDEPRAALENMMVMH